MNRRWLVLPIAALLSLGVPDAAIADPGFAIDPTRSDPVRPARPLARPYDGPLIDAHAHLDPPKKSKHMLKAVDDTLAAVAAADVAYAVFPPTPNDGLSDNADLGAEQRFKMAEDGSGRAKALCGGEYLTVWMDRAAANGYAQADFDALLARLAADIDGGRCAGVGEIGITHFNKKGDQAAISIPPTFPPLLAVVDLVAAKGAWLDIHAEPVEPDGTSHEDAVFSGIAEFYRRAPNLKLIASHTLMTNPANFKALMTLYPSLMTNFKIVRHHEGWRNLESVTDENGALYEDWAALFETFADRIMVGSDAKFGRDDFPAEKYVREIQRMRELLGVLPVDTARKIAYDNAARVFGEK